MAMSIADLDRTVRSFYDGHGEEASYPECDDSSWT
jgi:hypothetical protein